MDDDSETTELQSLMEVIPDKEEVAIDAIPLAVKPPKIARYGSTRPEEGSDRVLWGDLKTIFLSSSQNSLRIHKVFRSILLVMVKLLMKKLDDFGEEYQVYERIVGIKRLLDAVGINAALIDVNAAQLN
ncbi:hypothetical protein Tco_0623927 [Tanacetum coccineum]|uniref:Uncharacterized protein n=1 Tax=Tanacetum coccineum TaxID=301880 RepID=A0ABQ4WCE3_9ASTR